MTGDEFVNDFGNGRESRNVMVAPGQPTSRRSISRRAIDGFRGKERFAVRLNQNHCALELFDGNFGESVCDLLVRCVIDLTGGDYLPAFDPQPAEITFAIPDQERLCRWMRNAEMFASLHKRRTSNAQRPTSNSESEFDVGRSTFLDIKLRPHRGMIGRFFAFPHLNIDS